MRSLGACIALLRRHRHSVHMRVSRILVDAALDLAAEMADEALDRPRGGVAEGADGVALHLRRHVEKQVDLASLRPPLGHPREDAPQPAGALPAGRALAA